MKPRPELPCCTPEWSKYFPSGPAWAHARDCKVHRGQKVRPGEDHPVLRGRRGWWSPQPYAGKAAEIIAFKAHTGRWRS